MRSWGVSALIVGDHRVDDGHLISGCLPGLDNLPKPVSSVAASDGTQVASWMTLQNLERDDTVGALEIHHHDLGRTAEALGIHRKMLQRMLRSHDLS
jgi:hypothetical protein